MNIKLNIIQNAIKDKDLTEFLKDSVGFNIQIVDNNSWNPYKHDPTETSEDNKTIRIKEDYFNNNPKITLFDDECGWAYHELIHAMIFSKRFSDTFKDLKSLYTYPLNADEIYAFGFQMKNIKNTDKFNRLLKYYNSHSLSCISRKLQLLSKYIN